MVPDTPVRSFNGLIATGKVPEAARRAVPHGVAADGLPIAIEILGRPFSEPTLVRLAHAYEQASKRRILPKTTPPLPGEVIRY